MTTTAHRVLLNRQGVDLTIIDELIMNSTAPRAVWLRAFPVAPRVGKADGALFQTLEQDTAVLEPYNQMIRRNLFGPSIVTLLNKKLGDPVSLVLPPSEPPPRREITVSTFKTFTGKVTTSTLTRELALPLELQDWLSIQGISADEPTKTALAAQLNRGWVVLAAVVTDSAPGPENEAQLGPIRFDLPTKGYVYPVLRREGQSSIPVIYDFYALGPVPLAVNRQETLWNTRPWELDPNGPAPFEATYSAPLEPAGPLAFELGEKAGLTVDESSHLIRVRYHQPKAETWQDLEFQPSRENIRIPGGSRRGSGLDLLLCVLLGLTPLIYTPESWFLIWLVNSAKERARRDGSDLGVNLWAYFALLVALYWVLTLSGPGRIAALVPFLLGIGRLALPYTDRERPQIRVAYKARKKA